MMPLNAYSPTASRAACKILRPSSFSSLLSSSSPLSSTLRLSSSASTPSCPLSYRSSPSKFGTIPLTNLKNPDLLYVVGGLYGNTNALSKIAHLASLESTPPTIIFNGDFNFFNVSPSSFHSINSAVLNGPHHVATAGNVEREISSSSSYIGCGCSYPSFVGEAVVSRSDDIVSRLHETCRNSEHHKALGELPPYLKTVVGGKTVGVLHGDFHSLAGWSFAAEAMTPVDDDLHKALGVDGSFRVTSGEEVVEEFEEAGVDIVACTHTCLAFGQKFTSSKSNKDYVLFNSGSAGMSNFKSTTYGCITRISSPLSPLSPSVEAEVLYSTDLDGVNISALKVEFDNEGWREAFKTMWGEGSSARLSYWERIKEGVGFWGLDQAAKKGVKLRGR
ncbi:hypothetical protein TrCOL_g10995 [Triparma columacea]|uniref:Uncharacterized protein n=1 Tax=Triparma columacea TaxID=722753 RepID=A0A9W7GCZ6_9STRA|nr:hypothetical protein TrCOL_g10995 [Triparma columacea]